jgi:hypothetical protein
MVIVIIFLIILSFLDYTHWTGIHKEEDTFIHKKIFNRYYFVASTISSVGYGDISPKSYLCKSIVSVLQILVTIHILSSIGKY